MSVLITIAIIYLLIMLFSKVLWPMLTRKATSHFEQKINDYFRQAQGGFDPFGAGRAPGREPEPERPHKVFSRDMGEYVAFEDIADPGSRTTTETFEEVRAEEQVSDADWEEVR